MKYLVEGIDPLGNEVNCFLECPGRCECKQMTSCDCNYMTCGCHNPGNRGSICGTHCWGDMEFPIDPWSLDLELNG